MIVFQPFLAVFHKCRHDKVKKIIQYSCHDKWQHGTFRGRNRLRRCKHFHHRNGKSERSILHEGNHFIRNRRQYIFPDLWKDNAKETLCTAVAENLRRLHLSLIHRLDSRTVNFCKIRRIIHHKADINRHHPVSRVQIDFENIIGSIVHDKKLEHERRSPHNGNISLRETR